MTDPAQLAVGGKYRCPYCDAINFTDAEPPPTLKCWMCAETYPREQARPINPAEDPDNKQGFVFGLTTLMLIVTLAAVGFGLFRSMPGLGAMFIVLLTAVMVRAQVESRRDRDKNPPLTWKQEFKAFFTSFATVLGIVFLIIIAIAIAFFGTCIFLMSQF